MAEVRDGYKMTEFGEIPVNWEVKLMGELYRDLKTGATPYRGKKEYYVGDIPWLSSGELKKKYISKTNEYISTEAVKDTNLTIYEPGTFFIAITGLEAAGTRGSCGIITIPTTTNQSCLAFQINTRVNNEYLYYWYLYWGEWIAFNYAQGTKQQSLNLKIVESLKILLPPIQEQQKIAEILSTVDEHIEQTEKLIEKTKELKKGLMQQLLTKGIGHTEFKQSELGEIPVSWSIAYLKDLTLNVTIGLVTSMTKNYVSDGVKLIRNSDIKEGFIRKTNLINLEKGFAEKNRSKMFKLNDIVTVHTGDIGTSAVIDESMVDSLGFATLQTSVDTEKYLPKWLMYFFNSKIAKNQFYNFSTGDGRNNLNLKEFIKTKVIIPNSLEEQHKIAEILTTVDEQLESYQKEKAKYEKLKKGLMQQLLTGKVRVKIDE